MLHNSVARPFAIDVTRLTAVDIGHRFPGGPWLFRHVDFEAVPGRTIALTGPSGSGKSTLLAVLGGLLIPSEGEVSRNGLTSDDVAWVFQRSAGIARRTALDHVLHPMLAKGLSRQECRDRALLLLYQVGLGTRADALFSELSGGEAQRLALARAAACSRAVMLIDEPTAALDRTTAVNVADALPVLSGGSACVLIATHDPVVIARCDEEIMLSGEQR
jgi:lipoprotein-releasing system ATP-binding protein